MSKVEIVTKYTHDAIKLHNILFRLLGGEITIRTPQ